MRSALLALVAIFCSSAYAQSDWRQLDPANTLYMELESGRVVIELAPHFAPRHVTNIRQLVRERYFDDQRINRVQDNFVVQWGDPDIARPLKDAKQKLAPEFTRPAHGLNFTRLADPDTYAPETGFADGFPAARDSAAGTAWAVHCYGTVGVGRGNEADSGDGTELYAVIGQAPRQLDRNITIVGRVVYGIERLSSLPRGTSQMGFHESPTQRVRIKSIRLGSENPQQERLNIELLRTDSPQFAQHVQSRRHRADDWYKVPADRIDVCNVPLPTRLSQ